MRACPDDIRVNSARSAHVGLRNNGGVFFRVVAVTVVWGVAAAFDLAVARWTKIGPVVLRLGHGHGVHLGDVAAGVVASTVAAVVTVVIVRRSRGSASARGKHRPGVRAEA